MASIVLPTEVGSIVAPPQGNPDDFDSYVLGYDGQWYADERRHREFLGALATATGWFPVPNAEVEEYILDYRFRDIQLLSDVIPE